MQFNRKINTPWLLAAALLKCFTKHVTFLHRINVKTFHQLQFLREIVLVKHYWHTLTHISRRTPVSCSQVNSHLAWATSTCVPRWFTQEAWKPSKSGAEVSEAKGQRPSTDPRSRWQLPLLRGLSSSLTWPWSQSISLECLPVLQSAPSDLFAFCSKELIGSSSRTVFSLTLFCKMQAALTDRGIVRVKTLFPVRIYNQCFLAIDSYYFNIKLFILPFILLSI